MKADHLTPRAQQALLLAERLAADHGHSYVGTEHLFVALMEVTSEGRASAVVDILSHMGLDPGAMRITSRHAFEKLAARRAVQTEAAKVATEAAAKNPDPAAIAAALRAIADQISPAP